MTKMTEVNADRLMPRESREMLPEQSHISWGMTVLADYLPIETLGEAKPRRKSNALVSMFSYSRCRFEKEGLLCRYVTKEELLDGCLSTSARGKVESGDMTRRREEMDPCWPKRRIFVHWRSSVRAMEVEGRGHTVQGQGKGRR